MYQRFTGEVKAISMRSVIVNNSSHPNAFHLSTCLQQVGHACTTIASGYINKWAYGVPFDHSSVQTNVDSSLRMEHLCQSLQTRLQQHQKCSEKSVVLASQPSFFAQQTPKWFKTWLPCSIYGKCGGQCQNDGSVTDECE